MTPSTIVERIEASVNEIAGGESMMMCAKRSLKSPSSRRISSEPSNSAGFGGTGPDVRIFRLCVFAYVWKRLSRSLSPDSHVVKPFELLTSNCVCSRGRLKSQSMIKTSTPVCASMNAVLMAVVVFPSEGWLDVTRIVFGGCPAEDNSNDVRRWRYDSAIGDLTSSIIASAVVSEGVGFARGNPFKLAPPRLAGIIASAGK